MNNLIKRAQGVLQPYRESPTPPHPSFTLQLPDEVYTSSNLFAYQKMFEGPFQFDVLYDSGSAKQKLSRVLRRLIRRVYTDTLQQLLYSIKGFLHWLHLTNNGFKRLSPSLPTTPFPTVLPSNLSPEISLPISSEVSDISMALLLSIEGLPMNGTKTTRLPAIISTTDRPLRNRKHCSQLLRVVVSSPEGSTGMH